MADTTACPACGSAALAPAGPPDHRAVCTRCGRCWEDGGAGAEVDTLACPGCPQRCTCQACPTWLAESMARRYRLADGQVVVVRPLLYGDRTISTRRLTVPHPRLTERPFALVPLIEVAPGAALPDGRSLVTVLAGLAPIEPWLRCSSQHALKNYPKK